MVFLEVTVGAGARHPARAPPGGAVFPSKLAALLAAALAALPLVAKAQTAEAAPPVAAPTPALAVAAAAPPAPPPAAMVPAALESAPAAPGPWSLGAGVAFGSSYVSALSRSSTLGSFLILPSAPAASASLERAVGTGRWLVLGLLGGVEHHQVDAPAGSGAITEYTATSIAASVGLRSALTRAGAPVCVSLLTLLTAGYGKGREEIAYATPVTWRLESWSVGASLGLAVDRELSPGLSLRLATPLLVASWERSSQERSDQEPYKGSDGAVALALAPSLELRLAF
jgi:hypothetical protein